MTDDDCTTFVAYGLVDLMAVLGCIDEMPPDMPVRILFRGATLDFPTGMSSAQLRKLAHFAQQLDSPSAGVH